MSGDLYLDLLTLTRGPPAGASAAAGPVPAAQPAQPPGGQRALTGHLLGFRDMPLSGILSFSAFGGCVYTFFTAFCLVC